MTKLLVGIVDYGVGNHASVRHCLLQIGLNCRISNNPELLKTCDLLLLPGVGAFRPAMEALRADGLDRFLMEQAERQKPILGICLGMQLLTEGSHEGGITKGLNLIPGQVVPLGVRRWHIGWNTLDSLTNTPLFQHSKDETYYFNHAYCYEGPKEFQVCETQFKRSFATIIRRNKLVGIQFHPEKSQAAGHRMLKQVIEGLCDA
jgi:glutamine amidotransferase